MANACDAEVSNQAAVVRPGRVRDRKVRLAPLESRCEVLVQQSQVSPCLDILWNVASRRIGAEAKAVRCRARPEEAAILVAQRGYELEGVLWPLRPGLVAVE